jgi:hypothetical protein
MNGHLKLLPGTASSNTEEEPDLRTSIYFSSAEGGLDKRTSIKARSKQILPVQRMYHM